MTVQGMMPYSNQVQAKTTTGKTRKSNSLKTQQVVSSGSIKQGMIPSNALVVDPNSPEFIAMAAAISK